MAFGYVIGMVLLGIFYTLGMKIIRYLDPEPPQIPNDKETEFSSITTLCAFGKSYRCIKTVKIHKTYGYDADQNALEFECRHIQFKLEDEYSSITDNGKVIVYEEETEPIDCYVTNGKKYLISYNPIISERIYEYRKSWKNKALSA